MRRSTRSSGPDVRRELLHRALRRRARTGSISRSTSTPSTPTCRIRRSGLRSASRCRRRHRLRPRTGRPLSPDRRPLAGDGRDGEISYLGAPAVSWLGVPLPVRRAGRSGVIAVQSYREDAATASATSRSWRSSPSTSRRRSSRAGRSTRPASGTPSWPSSTRSARRSPSSSSSRRSSSSSASGSAASSSPIAGHRPVRRGDRDAHVPVRRSTQGERLERAADRPLGPGLTSTVIRTRRAAAPRHASEAEAAGAILIGGVDDRIVARRADPRRRPGHRRRRPRERRRARLRRGRRAAAGDAGLEHGRGPRERPPVRRDEAAARPRPISAHAELGGHQRDRRRRSPSSSTSRRSSSSSASGSGRSSSAGSLVHRAARRCDTDAHRSRTPSTTATGSAREPFAARTRD